MTEGLCSTTYLLVQGTSSSSIRQKCSVCMYNEYCWLLGVVPSFLRKHYHQNSLQILPPRTFATVLHCQKSIVQLSVTFPRDTNGFLDCLYYTYSKIWNFMVVSSTKTLKLMLIFNLCLKEDH